MPTSTLLPERLARLEEIVWRDIEAPERSAAMITQWGLILTGAMIVVLLAIMVRNQMTVLENQAKNTKLLLDSQQVVLNNQKIMLGTTAMTNTVLNARCGVTH